jgi:hypothetical protein
LKVGNQPPQSDERKAPVQQHGDGVKLPTPSPGYRRRAWIQFQRALDPLAPIKPLPPPRH